MQGKQTPFSQRLAFGMMNACLLVIILYYGKELFIPIFFALLFALLLLPFTRALENTGLPRIIAVFITLSVIMLIIGFLLTLLARQFGSFSGSYPLLMHKLNLLIRQTQQFFRSHFGVALFSGFKNAQSGIAHWMNSGPEWITNTLFVTTGLLIDIGVTIVYVFFLLLYRHSLTDFIFHLFPNQNEKSLKRMMDRLQKLIQGYILGIFLVITIIAVLNSIGLTILGIENAILLGTIAACFSIIPYIGVFVGAIIPFLVAFITKDSPWYGLGVVGLAIVVHLLEGNFITPYFVGRRVRLNPLTAILGMFAGNMLWGLPGIVLAIPTLAVVKSFFDSVPSLSPFGFMLGLEISDGKSDLKELLQKLKHSLEKKPPSS